jgi:RNA polymerase sigma-70 factor (ECF subfamily)
MTTATAERFSINSKGEFEKIFRDHYSSLCAYAAHFLKDPDASEEVVQEVMYRLWINRSTIIITGSLQSYLFRSVRNSALNVLKHMDVREAYRRHREQEAAGNGLSDEDGLIVSELQEKIRIAIDRLPMERRKVFIMSRYDGFTYSEIAETLEISVKTVENQMGKALKFLREELAEYLPWLVLFFFDIFRD